MRKRIISQAPQEILPADQTWLDLETLAQVEVTSEDPAHPIESALLPEIGSGWKAAVPGEQTIRILFEQPQRLRRICLLFREDKQERSQEFVLRRKSSSAESFREIVRQQYNFSPPSTTEELEIYQLQLDNVIALELTIIPDRSGGSAHASLSELRLA